MRWRPGVHSTRLGVVNKVHCHRNQTSKPEQQEPDADTLAADSIRKRGRRVNWNGRRANETRKDAHAELEILQELYRQGRTEGRSLKMVVSGEKICPFCREDLPAAAEAAGFEEWTIFEELSGNTLYWKRGSDHFVELEGYPQ